MGETNENLKGIVESALLVSDSPLTLDRMLSMFEEKARPTREEIRAVLDELAEDYKDRGVELKQIEKGFRFQTRPEYAPWLNRLWQSRTPRYSRALLETLAIIAYRQPVTRGEIEEIRGVTVSSEIVKTLLAREWIRQVGHRDIPGKPALFGTTRGFLEHFNLKSLSELPPLSELREPESIARELNLSFPLEDDDEAAQGESGDTETGSYPVTGVEEGDSDDTPVADEDAPAADGDVPPAAVHE
jgi:segregation and condensation protein B